MQPGMFSSLPWLPRSSEAYMLSSTAEHRRLPGCVHFLILNLSLHIVAPTLCLVLMASVPRYVHIYVKFPQNLFKGGRSSVCVCMFMWCICSHICTWILHIIYEHTHMRNAESISIYIFPRSLLPASLSAPGSPPVVCLVTHKRGHLAPKKGPSHMKTWVSDKNIRVDLMEESEETHFCSFLQIPSFVILPWVEFILIF